VFPFILAKEWDKFVCSSSRGVPSDTAAWRSASARLQIGSPTRRCPLVRLGLLLLAPVLASAQFGTGTINEYAIPAAGSRPQGITIGPDRVSVWFTDPGTSSIGKLIQAAGLTFINEFPTPTANSGPTGIVAVPGGDLWFTETNANQIGRVTMNGTFIEYPIPTPASGPTGIAYDGNSTFWFTERDGNKIASITTAGVITEYPIPTASSQPNSIAANGSFGGVWFTEQSGNKIGFLASSGAITEYSIPTPNSVPVGALLTNGILSTSVTFAEYAANNIAVITQEENPILGPAPPPSFTEYPLPTANSAPSATILNAYGSGTCFAEAIASVINCLDVQGGNVPNVLFYEYAIPTPSSNPQGITWNEQGYWFTEEATGKIGLLSFTNAPALTIVTPELAPAAVGAPYSFTVAATGGTPPYTWSAIPNSLPSGLSLSAAGLLTGTPTTLGTQTFNISVTDATGTAVASLYTLQVGTTGCTFVLSSSGKAFPAIGGVGQFGVETPAGCPWSISEVPAWISVSTDPQNSIGPGIVNFVVSPNSTAMPLNATLTVAGQSFNIQEEAGPAPYSSSATPANFMPHLVAEGGWSTSFTLVNTGSTPANTDTVFYDDNGNFLSLPLTFPQQSAASNSAIEVNQSIAPNQSLIFQASGPASVSFVEGSAQIWTNSPSVQGFAIFHYDPSGQEAVVPLGGSGNVIPFDNTNGLSTGIALENMSGSEVGVSIAYYNDAGSLIFTDAGEELAPYGHTSFVVAARTFQTANMRGAAVIGPCLPTPNPFCPITSNLGIRYTPPGTLTTVAPLNTPAAGQIGSIPHIASGAGWQTTFVISNTPSSGSTQAELAFFDDNGNPLSLTLTNLDTGVTTTASSVSQTIPAYGTVWLTTSGDVGTPLLTGSAQLTGASGFAIFRYNSNGQEAVSPMQVQSQNSVIAFDNTNGTATGVALANGSAQAVSIPVTIRDDQGNQIGTSSLPLAANGHTSFMLASQYPATANIQGTVEFDAVSSGGQTAPNISVLGIRSPPDLTFTTLPALPK
jgi:virginiamycin B lyase